MTCNWWLTFRYIWWNRDHFSIVCFERVFIYTELRVRIIFLMFIRFDSSSDWIREEDVRIVSTKSTNEIKSVKRFQLNDTIFLREPAEFYENNFKF